MKRLFYGAIFCMVPFLTIMLWQKTTAVDNSSVSKHSFDRKKQAHIKALFNALEAEDPERVELLLEAGAPVDGHYRGMSPLIYVARLNKFFKVAWALLDAGADVDAQDESGKTALMWVVDNASKENVELARLLLEYGADIYKKDFNGRSVLDRVVAKEEPWDRQKGHEIRELILIRVQDR